MGTFTANLHPVSARIWRGNKPYMEHLGRDSLRAFACNLRRELTFFTWPLPITFEHYILRIGFTTELLIPLTCWMLLRIIPIDAECFGACLNLVTVRKQSSLFYEGTSTNLQYPLVLWTSVWAGPNPDTFPWLPKRTCMAWFWWHQRCNH